MNALSCCSACSDASADEIFPMGSYVPYTPGYGHTFSAYPSPSRPTGITPVGVAGSCAGESVSRPCNWQTATLGAYDRGDGNPSPYYPLPKMAPMGNYANTGNPTLFRPMSAGGGNGGMPMAIGSGMEKMGVQPMGFIWPAIAAGLGLAAIAGATYVAKSGVDQALAPETAQYLGDPIVKTTGNVATIAIAGLVGYLVFRKDIERWLTK